MARQARAISNSGIYHVIIRGIGKQILFEDDSDRLKILALLRKYKLEQNIRIFTYCLMNNHVHLLLQDEDSQLPLFMKKLELSYAYYFNRKYERVGALFQDRYKSEPVDSDGHFMLVFRYILRNPEKAGICPAADYPWSAYTEYVNTPVLVDTAPVINLFGSKADLYSYLQTENDDLCMELSFSPKGDTTAASIMRELLGISSGTELQAYEKGARDQALCQLKAAGLSIRQIERLTGISRGIVQRASVSRYPSP